MKKNKHYFLAFIFLSAWMPLGFSQAVNLTISPESSIGEIGSTVTFTVSTSSLDDVVAFQFDYQWDNSILELQLPLSGLNQNFSTLFTNQPNPGSLATQWVYNNTPQSLGGVLYELHFTVVGVGNTSLTVQNNSFSPIVALANGDQATVTYNTATFTGTQNHGAIYFSGCDDQSFVLPAGSSTMPVSWTEPTVSTTCPTNNSVLLVQTQGPLPGASLGEGAYSISFEATDSCSNAASCSFLVTVSGQTTTPCPSSIPGFTKVGELNNHAY